jgi:hypothetical protein
MSLMNVAILILYSTVITSEPINFDNLIDSDRKVLDVEGCNKINYLESNEHYMEATGNSGGSGKKVVDLM